MTSRGRKTRELPNLTECHCCHRRVDLAKSNNNNNKLHLLYSEWRIVLLCNKCLSRVESTELCSYCFNDSSSGDDCFSCRQCRRRVHRDCDSEYRSSAVWSGSSSAAEEVSVCGDCWVSESLARWRRSRNGGGRKNHRLVLGSRVCDDERKCDLNSSNAVCDSSTEETRCSRLEVVEEHQENVDDVDYDVALKEGQGSCSNGVDSEPPPCSKMEDCNCVIRSKGENRIAKLDPYYFKYTRRRISNDCCLLTYKRRSIGIVDCYESLSNADCALLTYKRRGSVNARFMFTYKRRRNFEQCMLTYKRRRPGILYVSSKTQLEGPALDPDGSKIMSLGGCGLYVSFGKKKSVVGSEQLSPSPQKYVSDCFESSPNTIMWCSKSSCDRDLVTEKKFRHRRSSSQGNIHKPPQNILIPGKSSGAGQAVNTASQADKDLVTEKKFSHQRSFSQDNCYVTPRNNLVPQRASDAKQAARHGLSSGTCHYYGHGNIIKGLNSITQPKTPASAEEINNLANMKHRKGYFKEAISLYDKAIALCPQNAAFHTNKAAAFISLGSLTEAVEECLKAIKCDPSCSRAHYRLGSIYTRFGQVDDARWHYMLSGKNIASETMQRLMRIEAHYANTNKARKVKDWVGVLRESTLCIEAGVDASNQLVALKAEALFKVQRVEEALQLVNDASCSEESRLTKPCKGTACLLILETKLNLYLGRFEKGVKSAEKAVEMDSTRKSLKWLKKARGAADARKCGNYFYKDKKYLEACTMFDQGLQYVSTSNILLCDRAACRSKLGQWEMAIDDCNAALRERPNFHKALLWRAHSYAKLRRWEDSLKDYSALSKEFPGDEFIASSLDQVRMELKAQAGRVSSLHPIVETCIY